jgi:hypothetical protein
MLLTVFASPVRPQKHSGRMLSCQQRGFKRVGLHYIDFGESAITSKPTCTTYKAKNRLNHPSRDELGLAETVPVFITACKGRHGTEALQPVCNGPGDVGNVATFLQVEIVDFAGLLIDLVFGKSGEMRARERF